MAMTAIELECLDSIRRGMKLWLRWEWKASTAEFDAVLAAMGNLEDILYGLWGGGSRA